MIFSFISMTPEKNINMKLLLDICLEIKVEFL